MACLADGYTTKVELLDCHVLAATSAKLNVCYWLTTTSRYRVRMLDLASPDSTMLEESAELLVILSGSSTLSPAVYA